MGPKNYYQSCSVPYCRSTSIKTPKKLFIHVPAKVHIRKKWLKLARLDGEEISPKSNLYFCEDHFDLPNDMANYMRYRLVGSVRRIIMKRSCLPSRFECQFDRKRQMKELVEQLFRDNTDLDDRAGRSSRRMCQLSTTSEKSAESEFDEDTDTATEFGDESENNNEKGDDNEISHPTLSDDRGQLPVTNMVPKTYVVPVANMVPLTNVVPAPIKMEPLDTDVSMYEDDVPSSFEPLFFERDLGDKQTGHRCNECGVIIVGFRYTCVQCPKWDICNACEVRAAHALHYVLRVPRCKPPDEVEAVLVAIKRLLAPKRFGDTLFQRIKAETKSEPTDEEFELPKFWGGNEINDNITPEKHNDHTYFLPPRKRRRLSSSSPLDHTKIIKALAETISTDFSKILSRPTTPDDVDYDDIIESLARTNQTKTIVHSNQTTPTTTPNHGLETGEIQNLTLHNAAVHSNQTTGGHCQQIIKPAIDKHVHPFDHAKVIRSLAQNQYTRENTLNTVPSQFFNMNSSKNHIGNAQTPVPNLTPGQKNTVIVQKTPITVNEFHQLKSSYAENKQTTFEPETRPPRPTIVLPISYLGRTVSIKKLVPLAIQKSQPEISPKIVVRNNLPTEINCNRQATLPTDKNHMSMPDYKKAIAADAERKTLDKSVQPLDHNNQTNSINQTHQTTKCTNDIHIVKKTSLSSAIHNTALALGLDDSPKTGAGNVVATAATNNDQKKQKSILVQKVPIKIQEISQNNSTGALTDNILSIYAHNKTLVQSIKPRTPIKVLNAKENNFQSRDGKTKIVPLKIIKFPPENSPKILDRNSLPTKIDCDHQTIHTNKNHTSMPDNKNAITADAETKTLDNSVQRLDHNDQTDSINETHQTTKCVDDIHIAKKTSLSPAIQNSTLVQGLDNSLKTVPDNMAANSAYIHYATTNDQNKEESILAQKIPNQLQQFSQNNSTEVLTDKTLSISADNNTLVQLVNSTTPMKLSKSNDYNSESTEGKTNKGRQNKRISLKKYYVPVENSANPRPCKPRNTKEKIALTQRRKRAERHRRELIMLLRRTLKHTEKMNKKSLFRYKLRMNKNSNNRTVKIISSTCTEKPSVALNNDQKLTIVHDHQTTTLPGDKLVTSLEGQNIVKSTQNTVFSQGVGTDNLPEILMGNNIGKITTPDGFGDDPTVLGIDKQKSHQVHTEPEGFSTDTPEPPSDQLGQKTDIVKVIGQTIYNIIHNGKNTENRPTRQCVTPVEESAPVTVLRTENNDDHVTIFSNCEAIKSSCQTLPVTAMTPMATHYNPTEANHQVMPPTSDDHVTVRNNEKVIGQNSQNAIACNPVETLSHDNQTAFDGGYHPTTPGDNDSTTTLDYKEINETFTQTIAYDNPIEAVVHNKETALVSNHYTTMPDQDQLIGEIPTITTLENTTDTVSYRTTANNCEMTAPAYDNNITTDGIFLRAVTQTLPHNNPVQLSLAYNNETATLTQDNCTHEDPAIFDYNHHTMDYANDNNIARDGRVKILRNQVINIDDPSKAFTPYNEILIAHSHQTIMHADDNLFTPLALNNQSTIIAHEYQNITPVTYSRAVTLNSDIIVGALGLSLTHDNLTEIPCHSNEDTTIPYNYQTIMPATDYYTATLDQVKHTEGLGSTLTHENPKETQTYNNEIAQSTHNYQILMPPDSYHTNAFDHVKCMRDLSLTWTNENSTGIQAFSNEITNIGYDSATHETEPQAYSNDDPTIVNYHPMETFGSGYSTPTFDHNEDTGDVGSTLTHNNLTEIQELSNEIIGCSTPTCDQVEDTEERSPAVPYCNRIGLTPKTGNDNLMERETSTHANDDYTAILGQENVTNGLSEDINNDSSRETLIHNNQGTIIANEHETTLSKSNYTATSPDQPRSKLIEKLHVGIRNLAKKFAEKNSRKTLGANNHSATENNANSETLTSTFALNNNSTPPTNDNLNSISQDHETVLKISNPDNHVPIAHNQETSTSVNDEETTKAVPQKTKSPFIEKLRMGLRAYAKIYAQQSARKTVPHNSQATTENNDNGTTKDNSQTEALTPDSQATNCNNISSGTSTSHQDNVEIEATTHNSQTSDCNQQQRVPADDNDTATLGYGQNISLLDHALQENSLDNPLKTLTNNHPTATLINDTKTPSNQNQKRKRVQKPRAKNTRLGIRANTHTRGYIKKRVIHNKVTTRENSDKNTAAFGINAHITTAIGTTLVKLLPETRPVLNDKKIPIARDQQTRTLAEDNLATSLSAGKVRSLAKTVPNTALAPGVSNACPAETLIPVYFDDCTTTQDKQGNVVQSGAKTFSTETLASENEPSSRHHLVQMTEILKVLGQTMDLNKLPRTSVIQIRKLSKKPENMASNDNVTSEAKTSSVKVLQIESNDNHVATSSIGETINSTVQTLPITTIIPISTNNNPLEPLAHNNQTTIADDLQRKSNDNLNITLDHDRKFIENNDCHVTKYRNGETTKEIIPVSNNNNSIETQAHNNQTAVAHDHQTTSNNNLDHEILALAHTVQNTILTQEFSDDDRPKTPDNLTTTSANVDDISISVHDNVKDTVSQKTQTESQEVNAAGTLSQDSKTLIKPRTLLRRTIAVNRIRQNVSGETPVRKCVKPINPTPVRVLAYKSKIVPDSQERRLLIPDNSTETLNLNNITTPQHGVHENDNKKHGRKGNDNGEGKELGTSK